MRASSSSRWKSPTSIRSRASRPAISIEQKTTSRNPRSTVATITETYDYLRLLFARVGHAFCYNCGREITQQSVQQIVDRIMAWPEAARIHVLAPIVRDRKGEYKKELSDLRRAGFVRAKIDGKLVELGDDITLNKNQRHTIDVMVDRLAIRSGIEKRLGESLEVAFKYGQDLLKIERLDTTAKNGGGEIYFSQRFACVECGISYPEITPRMFSFNSPHGACVECSGIGSIMYFDPELVVQNEDLSLADGAIAPWATLNFMQPVLESLAAHYKFSLDTAVEIDPGQGSQSHPQRLRRRRNRIHLSARRAPARLRARLRRRADVARPALQGDRVREHPRGPRILHEHAPVPVVRVARG